jgi:outer membrane PBP1 activator LpoA protein
LATLLLIACTPVQTVQQGDDAAGAKQMSAMGNHVAASRQYLDLAIQASGNQRQRYLVFAADELYLANDLSGAEKILSQMGSDIAPTNLDVWAEVTAQVQLARNEPEAALQTLNMVTSSYSKESAAQILLLRSDALFKLGRPNAAVASLVKREQLLGSNADIEANHRLIWSGLQTTGSAITIESATAAQDPVSAGWLELGNLAYFNRASLSELKSSLQVWQKQNPRHPASGQLLNEVLENLSALSSYPNRVAILLPLSGKQRIIGEAIRDGYMAAHFALGQNTDRPEIMVYDTARNGAVSAYQQAILSGAEFIVGPLLKEEVSNIARLGPAVTVLALNQLPSGSATLPGFYQFALSPEDEARAAANRAADEGMLNAVALVPDTSWGSRVLEAFSEQLAKRGGKLLAAQSYPVDTPDFSQYIREILLLDESYARRDRLAANLGKQLEFEPRRRQDVDLVFLGANAAAAKLLKPQLKFHYAGELPTFATSAVYEPGTNNYSDLNGIIFPDIPWLLNPNQSVAEDQSVLTRYWGTGATRGARFYALGYDAYYMTAILRDLSGRSAVAVNGVTGLLQLDSNGQIHRQLEWARIERGKPRILPSIPSRLQQEAEITVSQQ